MKKTLFVLFMGLVCFNPGSTSSAHQRISGVSSKTVGQPVELPLTSSDEIFLPTLPAPAAASPFNHRSVGEQAVLPALLAAGKWQNVLAKKEAPLKGYTTGNKSIDAFIVASAARNDLDPVLLYSVMHQESAFKPQAVSHKGACGLMQIIPATASRFGVRDIFNPQQNIEAGARYLRFLLDTFEGDVSLALAGYNAGEGNVKKYMWQIPPFQETIQYVRKIKQHYAAINNSPQPQTIVQGVDVFRSNEPATIPSS